MKITIYALHLGFGGVENYIVTLANMLCAKHDVEIISTYKILEKPAFPLDDRVQVSYLLEHDRPNQESFKEAVRKKQIFRILKEGIYSLKVLYLRHKRNKVSIQNCKSDVIISTRILHNVLIQKYAPKEIVKITTEHNHPHGNEKYIQQVVSSLKSFDYFVPISKQLYDLYQNYLKDEDVQLRHIPFCVNIPKVTSTVSKDLFQLVNVGRLSSEKAPLALVDLMKVLTQIDERYHMEIFGDGPLFSELKKQIEDANLSSNIHLHGYCQMQEIIPYYHQSLAYVMTSYTESFGLVLLEAMSCATPCVAFDTAEGANEIITDGMDGYLIQNRDFKIMAQKIDGLNKEESLYHEMCSQAVLKAQQYSFVTCQKAWLDLLDEVKEKKGAIG